MPSDVSNTYEDFSGAVLDDLAVSDSLLPRNCVRKGINVMFDRPRGAISQRYGTASVGSAAVSASNTIRGLHDFRANVSGTHRLYAAANGKISSYNGTSWSEEVTGLTTTAKVRFLTYLDQVVAINGAEAARYSTGGGSWSTSGGNMDVANWPLTKAAAILNGRVFAIGNPSNPNTAYKSSIVSGGAISWTSGNGTEVIKPNDGAGDLTSVTANGRVLLFFKERGLYRFDDNSLEFVVAIGTPSHESVVTDDTGATYYFGQGANSVGFYVTNGGYPKKISRPIQRWVESISASFYANVAVYTDGNKIVWSVGSITMGDNTYSNVHLVYNTADQGWEVYNYPDSFRVFSQFIDSSGNVTVVGGDTDGFVQTLNSGYTDGAVGATPGESIFTECEMSPFVITRREDTKLISEMMTFCKDSQGLNFQIGIGDGKFQHIGSLTKREDLFSDIPGLRGNTFYPKITGVNSGPPYTFKGFSVVKYTNEGVTK